jgi:fatty acid desaturase
MIVGGPSSCDTVQFVAGYQWFGAVSYLYFQEPNKFFIICTLPTLLAQIAVSTLLNFLLHSFCHIISNERSQ